jgi:hypothetical protein
VYIQIYNRSVHIFLSCSYNNHTRSVSKKFFRKVPTIWIRNSVFYFASLLNQIISHHSSSGTNVLCICIVANGEDLLAESFCSELKLVKEITSNLQAN